MELTPKKTDDLPGIVLYNGDHFKKPLSRSSSMAIIPQRELFSWEEIEDLGDLERLKLVMELGFSGCGIRARLHREPRAGAKA